MSLAVILIAGERQLQVITGQTDQRQQKVTVIKNIRATDSMPTGNINNFYWRDRRLPTLIVNSIQQPDLVPFEPDKAPHPIMAPEQI